MPDYSEEFRKFSKSVLCIKSLITEKHCCHYPALEILFGFHYWLHNQINSIHHEQKDEWYSTPRIIHVLFMNNFSVAYSVLQAFESNSLTTTSPLLRNMLETIVKMEYLASYPDERDNMIYADAVTGVKKTEKKNIIAEVSKDLTEEKCDEQAILKRINGKYHFRWYLEKLYGDPDHNAGPYKHFSQLTHSSMDKINQQLAWMHSRNISNLLCSDRSNYDYEILDTIPCHLELLLFRNIMAELRGNKKDITEDKFSHVELMSFLDELYNAFSHDIELQEIIKITIRVIKTPLG